MVLAGKNPRLAAACAAALIMSVIAANAAIHSFGLVAVGFGLYAPAGVVFAGLAFTLRDGIQEWGGRWWPLPAITAGALLSAAVSGRLAAASGAAFAVSELLDWAIYDRLRRRSWLCGIVASNVVGSAIDSVVFLWLAFASLEHATGLFVGKMWPTIAVVVIALVYSNARNRRT